MQAVILAGGMGTRLKPLTNILPKPLMPLGEKSILEIILRQLKLAGIEEVFLTCGYLSHIIKAFFEDGDRFGLKIKYSVESKPLGTAGPLSLIMNRLNKNFLVMNGDILTNLDFKNLFDFHLTESAAATIAVKAREVKVDFGVIKKNNSTFEEYIEKPIYNFDVSMGIYVFNKDAIKNEIDNDVYLDIPVLISRLSKMYLKIKCYDEVCEWLDIGRLDDYELAIEMFEKNKSVFSKDI